MDDPSEVAKHTSAIIFWLYIAAALYLSATTIVTIINLPAKQGRTTKQQHAFVFTSLAAVSFATLSFNMLHILIHSFQAWKVHQPTSFLQSSQQDLQSVLGNIWHWSLDAFPFTSFATEIVANDARCLWSYAALLSTLFVCVDMALEGAGYRVPRLWAFFGLSQILPISFAQNLFYLALLRGDCVELQSVRRRPVALGVVVAVYAGCLLAAPTVGARWLIPVVLLARLLLLTPLFIYGEENDGEGRRGHEGSVTIVLNGTAVLLLSASIYKIIYSGWPLSGIVRELFAHPAVTTLGCDFALSMLSHAAWYWVDQNRPTARKERKLA